ncbi:MAG: DUF3078 domain-containing protein [Bacteroidia bacterium]
MKKCIILIAFFATFQLVKAQENESPSSETPKYKLWSHKFQTGLNINQAEFSDNWKGGGVSSLAYGWFLNHVGNYQNKKTTINSDLQLQLGYLKNKGQDTRKNADRLFYDFKLGYKIAPKWDVFGSINLLSQFAQGFDYGKKSKLSGGDSLVSNFFAPAYLTSSIGLEYKALPYFWMRFGIGTLRQTFVLDRQISDAGLYGLEKPGDRLRNQAVLQYIANFDKNLAKNINLKARYSVNWDYFKAGQVNQFVHLFNTNLTLKASKYISTNVQVNIINDYDMDKKTQWSQILALGILYSLNRDAVRPN